MTEEQHGKFLCSRAKTIVYRTSEHFRNDTSTGFIEKTAEVTGVSRSTIIRVRREMKDTGTLLSPKRPKREPYKPVDDFDKMVIRNKIHDFYTVRKQLPTINSLHKVLQEDIPFPRSKTSLRVLLKNMGYKWRKTRDNRKVLIEKPNVVALRLAFYKKMKDFKDRGLQFVYIDETWIDTAYTVKKCWQSEETPGVIPPCNRGQRIIVVHAGTRSGFIPGALLTYKAKSTSGDYHSEMDGKNFTKWMEEMLIPNLNEPSVIVMDNASYHSMQITKNPTSATKKADIQEWLTKHDVPFTSCMLRPQLLQLARQHRPPAQYQIDELLQSNGHDVLRLPPYHPDFNPIELIWSQLKDVVRKNNVTFRYDDVLKSTIQAIESIGTDRWRAVCDHVERHIEECKKKDNLMDDQVDSIIINLRDDTSSESDDSDIM